MAKTAGVRVVPISICNLHQVMPPLALLPLGPIKDVFVRIHPPLNSTALTIRELKQRCFEVKCYKNILLIDLSNFL
jgi:1-acyl-sn-glycerol-3-phosphate acyltransferase